VNIKKNKRGIPAISTSSMPDIVFLLIIFFMISSVFKEFRGMPIVLPAAKKIEKLRGKRDVGYMWVDRFDRIMIDDRIVNLDEISDIMYVKRADPLSPLRVVSLKIDEEVRMGIVTDVQEELKKADCLNISYATKTKD